MPGAREVVSGVGVGVGLLRVDSIDVDPADGVRDWEVEVVELLDDEVDVIELVGSDTELELDIRAVVVSPADALTEFYEALLDEKYLDTEDLIIP